MSPKLIIIAILTLIALSLVYKFAKKLFKLFVIIVIILVIATGVSSYLLVKDVADLKENFFKEESLVIITDQNQHLLAYRGNFQDIKTLEPVSIELINSKTQEQLLQENYKIITIDLEAFDNIQELEFEDHIMSKQQALEILNYNSIDQLYLIKDDLNLEDFEDVSLDDLKAFIIAMMIKQELDEDGLKFLIEEYKKENINIYPETITFKLIDSIPETIFEDELPQ